MSLSSESGPNARQLERYLLGLLPDEDAERLDELSISDDHVAWRLRVAEDDLVDAYVSGTLAGAMRERFESFYLASKRRREKVEFARSFRGAIDRRAGPVTLASSRSMAPRSRPVWRFAAAAALFLVACGALYEDVRLRGALNDARKAGTVMADRARDLEQRLSDQRAASAGALREPESIHASRTAPDSAAARPAGTPEASRFPMMALVLLPQTRSVGPIATLAVRQGIDRVPLELRLESNDFPRYQVALRDPGTNHIVWRSDRISARTADNVPTVPVMVPASVLQPQHYSLELDGLNAAGEAEVVASYVFQMARR